MNQKSAWEALYKRPCAFLAPNHSFLAFMAEHYWGRQNLKFLDLGCGLGHNSLFLASKGYDITAVDYSKSACDKLQFNLLEQYKKHLTVINEDALDLVLDPSSFDCVLAVNLFDYLDLEQACSIARLTRKWLKPDGRLFARMLAQPLPEQLTHKGITYKVYSPNEMSQLFIGYDAAHRPETQYLEGLAVNNWAISATKDETTLSNDLKVTKIYYQADKTETWNRLAADRVRKLEQVAKIELPHLVAFEPHQGRCAIVGAAPSISNHVDELKAFSGVIASVNGAHNFLIKNGVVPRIHTLFEIDLEKVEDSTGGPPHKDVIYYICSHCDQPIFKQLEGHNRILWHCLDEGSEYQDAVIKLFPGEPLVTGGYVTFFRTLNIALTLGFRHFDIFGCDCSFEGKNTHYEGYHNDSKEIKLSVAAGTDEEHQTFTTTPFLSFIASEFIRFCEAYQPEVKIKVHGDGLLRCLHRSKYPTLYDIQATSGKEVRQFLINEKDDR